MNTNMRWAAHYNSLGIPLLRLRPGDKRLVDLGEHTTLEARATYDWNDISRWYEDEPYTNIAQPMGLLSGCMTFDIDSHEADVAFHAWRDTVNLPLTDEIVLSPRNLDSKHYRYRVPLINGEHPSIPSPPAFLSVKGFDVRADGSYCVLPPSSILINIPGSEPVGSPYRWDASALPHDGIKDMPRVPLTEEAVTAICEWRPPTSRTPYEASGLAPALPGYGQFLREGFGWYTGSRNRDCWRLAWRFFAQANRGRVYSVEQVESMLRSVYDLTPQGDHPFTWDEARRTIKSAYDSYTRRRHDEEQEVDSIMQVWRPE